MSQRYCKIVGTTKVGSVEKTFFEGGDLMPNLNSAIKIAEQLSTQYTPGQIRYENGLPRAFTYIVPYEAPGRFSIGSLGVCGQHTLNERGSRYFQIFCYSLGDLTNGDFIRLVLDTDAVTENEIYTANAQLLDRKLPEIQKEVMEKDRTAICNAVLCLMDGKKIIIRLEECVDFERRAREILVALYGMIPCRRRCKIGFSTYRRGVEFSRLRDYVDVFVIESDSAVSDARLSQINLADSLLMEHDDAENIMAWSRLTYEERVKYSEDISANSLQDELHKIFKKNFALPEWTTKESEGTIDSLEALINYHKKFPELTEDSEMNERFAGRINSLTVPDKCWINFMEEALRAEKSAEALDYCQRPLLYLGVGKLEFEMALTTIEKVISNEIKEREDEVELKKISAMIEEMQKEIASISYRSLKMEQEHKEFASVTARSIEAIDNEVKYIDNKNVEVRKQAQILADAANEKIYLQLKDIKSKDTFKVGGITDEATKALAQSLADTVSSEVNSKLEKTISKDKSSLTATIKEAVEPLTQNITKTITDDVNPKLESIVNKGTRTLTAAIKEAIEPLTQNITKTITDNINPKLEEIRNKGTYTVDSITDEATKILVERFTESVSVEISSKLESIGGIDESSFASIINKAIDPLTQTITKVFIDETTTKPEEVRSKDTYTVNSITDEVTKELIQKLTNAVSTEITPKLDKISIKDTYTITDIEERVMQTLVKKINETVIDIIESELAKISGKDTDMADSIAEKIKQDIEPMIISGVMSVVAKIAGQNEPIDNTIENKINQAIKDNIKTIVTEAVTTEFEKNATKTAPAAEEAKEEASEETIISTSEIDEKERTTIIKNITYKKRKVSHEKDALLNKLKGHVRSNIATENELAEKSVKYFPTKFATLENQCEKIKNCIEESKPIDIEVLASVYRLMLELSEQLFHYVDNTPKYYAEVKGLHIAVHALHESIVEIIGKKKHKSKHWSRFIKKPFSYAKKLLSKTKTENDS